MSEDAKRRAATKGCAALQSHPDYPVHLWYECALALGHKGDHEALGTDPLVRWPRQEHEVFAQIDPMEAW